MIKEGDALKAPLGMEHGLKNTGNEMLMVFSCDCQQKSEPLC